MHRTPNLLPKRLFDIIKRSARAFRDLRIRSKLIISFLFVVLIPTFILVNILMLRMTDIFTQKIYFINNINCQQIDSNFHNRIMDYIKLIRSFSGDRRFIENFTRSYDGASDYLSTYSQIMQDISRININNTQDAKFMIYTTNTSMLPNNDTILIADDSVRQKAWFKAIDNANGDIVFNPTSNDPGGKPALTCGKVLNSVIDGGYKNLLLLKIPEDQFYNLIKNEQGSKHIYLVDSNGFVITSTQRDTVGRNSSEVPELKATLAAAPAPGKTVEEGNSLVYLSNISVNSSKTSWKLIVIIPQKIFFSEINQLKLYAFLISIIVVTVALLLFFGLSYGLTIRLKKLVDNMSNIRNGSFDVFVEQDTRDEIGELSQSFRNMIERIENLISEVYVAELKIKELAVKKKEAELNALQSQINPHFLFNTMQSVGMNLVKKGDLETSDIISKFAMLLRESINWQHYRIPLASELNIVNSYLSIQKFRHRDKLDYSIDIPKELMGITIPKFTLQPLVENAIYHGIEKNESGGRISIHGTLTDGRLLITVIDDGVGMSEETLKELRENLDKEYYQSNSKSIGVYNVHQRLRLYYGSEFGISIESIEGAGTTVTISIPDNRAGEQNV